MAANILHTDTRNRLFHLSSVIAYRPDGKNSEIPKRAGEILRDRAQTRWEELGDSERGHGKYYEVD